MWIRSQHKRYFIDVYNIRLAEKLNGVIYGTTNEGKSYQLGFYQTDNTALKIIDKIQKHVENQINYVSNPSSMRKDDYWYQVFQMPECDEIW